MSGPNSGNLTTVNDEDDDEFPIAAIICLAVGGYVILIIGIIVLRQYCNSRGTCECCGGKTDEEGSGCCTCNACSKANEACPCCCKCNLDGCLSKMCGKPKKINCIDFILCNCGGCTENHCNSFKCCGCCPKDINCSCCTGLFSDCCTSQSEPGTCGCLCIEIKLRSPRGGSTRRSVSSPPGFRGTSRHFNTHSGFESNSIIKNGKHFGSENYYSNEDSVFNKNSIDSEIIFNNNKARLRSASHSPQHSGNKFVRTSQTNVKDLTAVQQSGIKSSVKDSLHMRRNSSKISFPEGNDNNERIFHKSNNTGNNIDNIYKDDFVNQRRKGSRLRRSIRSGQRSQRFPTHVLVDAKSLDPGLSSTKSGKIDNYKGQSLPQPSSEVRRPLPSVKRANKTH